MQYRLQQITEIQKLLESERQKREKLSRNYKKCLQAVKATEAVLALSFIGLSTVSVAFLSTVSASPAVTVIEAVSLGAVLLFIVGGFVSRHLILKAEKHRKIKLLADKQFNVISDLKRDLIVEEFLKTKKNIQEKFITERLGDISAQENFRSCLNRLSKHRRI